MIVLNHVQSFICKKSQVENHKYLSSAGHYIKILAVRRLSKDITIRHLCFRGLYSICVWCLDKFQKSIRPSLNYCRENTNCDFWPSRLVGHLLIFVSHSPSWIEYHTTSKNKLYDFASPGFVIYRGEHFKMIFEKYFIPGCDRLAAHIIAELIS